MRIRVAGFRTVISVPDITTLLLSARKTLELNESAQRATQSHSREDPASKKNDKNTAAPPGRCANCHRDLHGTHQNAYRSDSISLLVSDPMHTHLESTPRYCPTYDAVLVHWVERLSLKPFLFANFPGRTKSLSAWHLGVSGSRPSDRECSQGGSSSGTHRRSSAGRCSKTLCELRPDPIFAAVARILAPHRPRASDARRNAES